MKTKIKHLGIIMDGNRRWANARQLPSFKGHQAGYDKIEEVTRWCKDAEIKILTLYAFSTENWRRSKKEVGFLMNLFYDALTNELEKFQKNNIRLRVTGRKNGLSEKIKKAIENAEALTKKNTGGCLNLAINYGGRAEIVDACNKLLNASVKEATEDLICKNIYAPDLPDPDLIIRTSGEQRLSGFLTWQSAYSELCFIKHHWPEFSKQDFDRVISDYANRQRRFGK